MMSGDIARSSPGAMKVKTPTAILGVRGTSFVDRSAKTTANHARALLSPS